MRNFSLLFEVALALVLCAFGVNAEGTAHPGSAERDAIWLAAQRRAAALSSAAAEWKYSVWFAAGTQVSTPTWVQAHGGDESIRPTLEPVDGAGEASAEFST